MLWCQGAQDIGLSKHKLKSALECTVYHNAHPSQTDRQTDRQMNIMAIARRFVLTSASRAKYDLRFSTFELFPLVHNPSFRF